MNGHQNVAFSHLIGALKSPRNLNGYWADYAVEICDEQIDDNRKLQKECSDLSSKLSKLEKKLHAEHIRSMHLGKELVILHNTVIEKEKENEALKMEIEKRNDRIYSIENKLKKAEYDNRQLEEKLSQNNVLATE